MVENYQSDRSYPPFFLGVTSLESWYQAGSGVLRSRGRIAFPSGEFDVGETVSGSKATFAGGDTVRPAPAAHSAALVLRALDPWPLLYDWSSSGDVSIVGRCRIRDYPRMVLERSGPCWDRTGGIAVVAGVRYWVARGATVVSHRASRGFLERVLARRWTRTPDLYERRRSRARFGFRAVDDSLALAGGKLRLYSIDGIASEGGLIAYLEGDHFLWASDYIQTVSQPSTYATDVWRAVERAGIRPSRVAAEHLPLTEWGIVDSLAQSEIRKETT
jgi:hypothetical protein